MIKINTLVNNDFYNIIKIRVFVKPIGIHFLTTYLEIQDFHNKTYLYGFISKFSQKTNWKYLDGNNLLFQTNHICSNRKYQLTVCRVEDSDHFFMSCKYLDMFWNKINEMLKKIKFENNIRLQHLVFGYNIFDKEYFHLDYLSEQKTKKLILICYLKMNFKEKWRKIKY